jgi:uncharacterized damage-inducible protein DinB
MSEHEHLAYPIGRFTYDPEGRERLRRPSIEWIRTLPAELRNALEGIDDEGLEARYRPGAWTLRQLVHHIADGHGNSYFRFKLAMTEDSPAVKTWEETLWAETPDARIPPIESSLRMIDGIHERWACLLDTMTPADFARVYSHPQNGDVPLDWLLQYMAWHGRHHVAHVHIARGVPAV